jgi:hypothetical protein
MKPPFKVSLEISGFGYYVAEKKRKFNTDY